MPHGVPHLPPGGGAHLSEADLPTEMSKLSFWKQLCNSFLGEVLGLIASPVVPCGGLVGWCGAMR